MQAVAHLHTDRTRLHLLLKNCWPFLDQPAATQRSLVVDFTNKHIDPARPTHAQLETYWDKNTGQGSLDILLIQKCLWCSGSVEAETARGTDTATRSAKVQVGGPHLCRLTFLPWTIRSEMVLSWTRRTVATVRATIARSTSVNCTMVTLMIMSCIYWRWGWEWVG